ncbi:hypothetical protein Tco_0141309, partial [Tanacetum coccineum]
ERLSSLRTQLGQQQDDMISKINLLWKAVSEKLDDTPIRDTIGNPTAQMNFTSINDSTREEVRGKGIKIPLICTDIAKISRKRSKPDNHRHGNGIKCAKAGRMLSKVNKNSTLGQTKSATKRQNPKIPN